MVREIDVGTDAASIVDAVRALQLLEARVSAAVAAFDRAQLWDLDGARSMSNWLTGYTGLGRTDARRMAATASAVAALPATQAAWVAGALSSGQVQVIRECVGERLLARFAEMEAELVPFLAPLSITDTRSAMRDWAARATAELPDDEAPPVRRSTAHLSALLDGRARLDADLDAEGAAIVTEAFRLARVDDVPGDEPRALSQKNADALIAICRYFLDHRDHRAATRRNRPHVNVVIGIDDLATRAGAVTAGGQLVDAATMAKWLCDCDVHRVITGPRGQILDYGRARRSADTEQFNALVVRDRHCRWPGCESPPQHCDAHHVVPWEGGGPTDLDNLVLLCGRHHTVVHRPGWRAEFGPDGVYCVTDPQGRSRSSPPRHALRRVVTAA